MTRSRERLPSGCVTFVFTDVEGSTQMFRRIGDRYPVVLERHREILRDAWTAGGGHEVGTEGDSFFVAFADASAAVAACAQAQRALDVEPWPADAVLRVRMGLHTGLAAPRGDDYIALAVHQAARVVNAGHGGQIVMSGATAERLTGCAGVTVVSLGRYRVRDFDDAVELFQVAGPGLAADFPPVRVLPADGHNLVAPITSIVGRDDDLTDLGRLIRSARLVSVVGPGGLGKTRLVVEYGLRDAAEWSDGIWFVDLAPVSDPALISHTVAEALGVPIGDVTDAGAAVRAHLRDRHALVILDNCEQLAAAIAIELAALLPACPAVRVVVTSRQPLGLRSERVWRLAPLGSDEAAVALFCDRAGLAGDLEPALRSTVISICRVLDGLPLALELAAARCGVLTPAEILARLGDQRGLLRSSDPTLSARQRSVEDTIEWSHQLLSLDEQIVFRRLGVFAAGFDLGAATASASDSSIDSYEVPEIVWSLVSKSLVVSEPAAGSTRYRMLETIRAFALRCLDRAEERPAVAVRLAQFFLNAYGPEVHRVNADLVTERDRNADNLRVLIPMIAGTEVEMAQALACTVANGHRRGSPGVGVEEALRNLERLSTATPTRIGLLIELARLAVDCGMIDAASDAMEEASVLAAHLDPPPWVDGRVDQYIGVVAVHRGDLQEARQRAATALDRSTSPLAQIRLLNLLALAAIEQGATDDARDAEERGLQIAHQLGDLETCATALGNLAEIELRAGHYAAAARRQLECLALALELGSLHDVISSLIVAAGLASTIDQWAIVVRLQTAADSSMAETGLRLGPSDRTRCDQLLDAARQRLGASQYDIEMIAGKELNITDAVDQARTVLATAAAPDAPHGKAG